MSIVDLQLGSDANDGSYDHPFATVLYALAVRLPHENVCILPEIKSSECVTEREAYICPECGYNWG